MTLGDIGRAAPRYIAVEGPIGVGKTTLTKRLADTFNYELLLEKSEDNPFSTASIRTQSSTPYQRNSSFFFNAPNRFKTYARTTCLNRSG